MQNDLEIWNNYRNLDKEALKALGFSPFDPGFMNSTGKTLYLVPGSMLHTIPNGFELFSISGKKVIAGVARGYTKENAKDPNYIDDDTRGGFLAYGFHRN